MRPLQNRVTPMGEIIATSARGTLMGNRGCLHDGAQRVVKSFQRKAWITCVLSFKGRKRTLMSPGQYTELFFLDEATALAAGHRPCAECSRARYTEFLKAWRSGNPDLAVGDKFRSSDLDECLHRDRLDEAGNKRLYASKLDSLPDSIFIRWPLQDSKGTALVTGDTISLWSPKGHGPPQRRPQGIAVEVVTPRSIVKALAAGYRPFR